MSARPRAARPERPELVAEEAARRHQADGDDLRDHLRHAEALDEDPQRGEVARERGAPDDEEARVLAEHRVATARERPGPVDHVVVDARDREGEHARQEVVDPEDLASEHVHAEVHEEPETTNQAELDQLGPVPALRHTQRHAGGAHGGSGPGHRPSIQGGSAAVTSYWWKGAKTSCRSRTTEEGSGNPAPVLPTPRRRHDGRCMTPTGLLLCPAGASAGVGTQGSMRRSRTRPRRRSTGAATARWTAYAATWMAGKQEKVNIHPVIAPCGPTQ